MILRAIQAIRQSEPRRTLARAILGATLFGLALAALRFGVIENGLLPRDCGPGGADAALPCGLTWLLVQSFQQQGLGWLALLAGTLAFLFTWRRLAWFGWFAGVAGLVLYCADPAAVGVLLALFALLRHRKPIAAAKDSPTRSRQGQREQNQSPIPQQPV
ncbi:MAG: hypothetical protein LBI68_06505 [Azoarcus sp.]|jgi:hypothetical protein|nr:hypothetical protein [Azoarcus sp.]